MNNKWKSIYAILDDIPMVTKSKKTTLYFLVIILGCVFSLLSLYVFAEIADKIFVENTMLFDKHVSLAIYSLRSPFLTHIMIWISYLGAEIMYLIAFVGMIFIAVSRQRKQVILYGIILGMGVVINQILKIYYQRPRPDMDPIVSLSSFSFPSGHSMNSFIFYMLVSYVVYRLFPQKRVFIPVLVLCVVLIVLVGFSRVYLGVHYPTDVLAGYVAGFFIVATAFILKRVDMYLKLKDDKKK